MLFNNLGFTQQQRSKPFCFPTFFPIPGLFLLPVVVLFSLGMGGCTGRTVISQKPVLEEQFNPLSLQDDDIWEELKQPAPAAPETTLAGPNRQAVTDTSQIEQPQYIQGFRIQIFASPDRQMALEVKQRAELFLEEDLYLEFEAPYYKVRVGDCLSFAEAETLLKKIRKKGYSDAFRVRTTIKLQPGG